MWPWLCHNFTTLIKCWILNNQLQWARKKCRGTVGTLLAIDLSLWWTHIPCSNNVQSLRDFAIAALLGCHDGWQTESFCWGKVWRIHRCSCQKIAKWKTKKKLEELWYELFKLLVLWCFCFFLVRFGQCQSSLMPGMPSHLPVLDPPTKNLPT